MLADTRPGSDRVGTVDAFDPGETSTLQVHGDNGQCTGIPFDASAVSLNVTALGATAQSYLTIWPGGERPLAASLNPSPGQPPVPNAVTTSLSTEGSFDVYNHVGTVEVVIDVNGYYIPSPAGTQGPPGPEGPAGATGPVGPQGLPGVDGQDGSDGAQGLPGVDGQDGSDGAQGLPGVDGQDGSDGAQGLPGVDGQDGSDGAQGLPGVDGQDGSDGAQGLPGVDGQDGTDGVPVRRYGRTVIGLSTVDATGNVGVYSAAAVGLDGNPVIAYSDWTNGGVKVAACSNPTCDPSISAASVSTVDSVGGWWVSLTIGADGNPVISHNDLFNDDLRVAACTNSGCDPNVSSATLSIVDGADDVGRFSSITIGTDGNPVISYWDNTNGDLKVAACTNSACDPTVSAATLTALDDTGVIGGVDDSQLTSITIGIDGNPIISYRDSVDMNLKVAACTNPTCSDAISAAEISTIDDSTNAGQFSSITIGIDGNPIISYYLNGLQDLKVAACTNPTCDPATSAATFSILDSAGTTGQQTSISVAPDGNPVIAYSDFTGDELVLAQCTNPTCNQATSAALLTTVDASGDAGRVGSLAIGADGQPVVSYWDVSNQNLKVAKLTRMSWTQNNWDS